MVVNVNLSSIKFHLFSTNVTQEFLHNSEPLKKDILLKPCEGYTLKSGEYRCPILKTNLMDEFNLKFYTLDLAVYFNLKNGNQLKVCAVYSDNFLHAKISSYSNLCKKN